MTDPRTPISLRHLVVATDFSPCSDEAFKRADAMAAALGAQLSLLHVVQPLPVVSAWGDPGSAAWIGLEALQQAGDAALRRQLDAHPQRQCREVGLHCRIGQARRDLGTQAQDLGGDLLVLGTHPPRGLGERLLGSTAQAALHGAPLPMLVCRRPAHSPWRRVLAASDFSPASDTAVALADTLASDAERRLLHVHAPLPEATLALMQPDPAQLEHFRAEAEAAASQAFSKLCEAHPAWIGLFRRGEPEDTTLREAQSLQIDLIALGTRGHGPWLGSLLGSIGQRVLAQADADVLIVPDAASRLAAG